MQNFKLLYIVLTTVAVFLVANLALSYNRSPSEDTISGDLITITTSASGDVPIRIANALKWFSNVCTENRHADFYLTLLNTENGALTSFLNGGVAGIQPVTHWISNEFFHNPGSNIPETFTWTFSNVPDGNYLVAIECQAVYPDSLNNSYSFYLEPSNGRLAESGGGLSSVLSGQGSFTVFNNIPIISVDYIIDEVNDFNFEEAIEQGLLDKLIAVKDALERNKTKTAINILKAFINQVKAQKGKKITNEQANALLTNTIELIKVISD